MKLFIERSAFLKALNHCQGIVERRTTLPILSHILLVAQNDTLQLTATDLELSAVETTPASVSEEGRTTVAAHLLYDIVRKMHDGAQVSLVLDASKMQMVVSSGCSEFRLPCLPAEDFPAVSMGSLPHTFTLPTKTIRQLIDKTKFAMSSEETRYFLNGIYLHTVEDQSLRAVATDGHRLAQATAPLPQGANGMPGVIISRKTVAGLIKILSETADETVQISVSTSQIAFRLNDLFMTSRLIDGKYPAYQEAIPKSNNKFMHVNVKNLSKAVDRVATITTDKFSAIKLFLEEGRLTLSATNESTGAAQEELEVAYQGEPMTFGFNARYLLDIAQQLDGEEAEVAMADGATAITMRASSDDPTLYVLMPMRV